MDTVDYHRSKNRRSWPANCFGSAAVVIALLAGIAPGAGNMTAAAASAPPNVVVAGAVHWINPGEPEEAGLIQAFQQQYPAIRVNLEHDDNYGDEFNLHLAPLPSIMTVGTGSDFAQALDRHYAADLTGIWQETGLLHSVPASLQKLTVRNGNQYYVPSVFGWEAVYYNKDIFARYNLQPPKTWDEFLALNDTLRSHGETPLAIGANGDSRGYWLQYLVLRLYGAQVYHDLVNGHIPFGDPRMRHALELWQSLFTRGDFPTTQLSDDAAMMNALVRSGPQTAGAPHAVMALTDAHVASQLAPEQAAELGFFRFPIMNPALPVAEATWSEGYAAPAGQPLSPETKAFLTFAASAEGQAAIAQGRTDLASMRGDLGDRQGAAQQQAIELFRRADDAVLDYYGALPGRMVGMYNDTLTSFVNNPQDIEGTISQLELARRIMLAKGAYADSTLESTTTTTQAASDLVGKLLQIGTAPISDALSFQVDASDPAVAGTLADSPEVDGIDHVDFELFGPDGQHLYHHLERWAPYCGFDDGDPCNIYNFADHDYKWPKGQPIANGPLRMVATIYARDGRVKTIDTTVTIQGIPEQHAPENSAGDQVQHDYGSGVQVPLGYFMEEKHD